MRFLNGVLLSALLVAGPSNSISRCAAAETSAVTSPLCVLLNQPEAPLEILEYSARYGPVEGKAQEGGIEHQVTCQNVGDRKIVAVEITFLSFDIWNELFDRTTRTLVKELTSGAECGVRWFAPLAEGVDGSSFHTGVAYVSRIRFDDGKFWSADRSELAGVLEKVAPDIPPSSL